MIQELMHNLPLTAGRFVGVTTWRDELIIACEYRIYRVQMDELWNLSFKEVQANKSPEPLA